MAKDPVHPESIEAENKRREALGYMPLSPGEMMTKESKECLRLGIDLNKYKQAFAEQMNAWLIADKLVGEHRADYYMHWAPYDPLKNWTRATFGRVRVRPWPYGNWWTVYRTIYDPVSGKVEREVANLVMR